MISEQNCNHLSSSLNPYLRQHRYQPVDWYPWGNEPLRLARESGRLVLVSIGYSTCHWCHVMAHDVFDDPQVAEFQNRHFVSIKVDREERPDIDQVYMLALQALDGQGGWPLNAFCLPDGHPIHVTTYMPKEAWLHTLRQLHALWLERPEDLQTQAEALASAVRSATEPPPALPELSLQKHTRSLSDVFREVWSRIGTHLDLDQGGLRGAPKFPLPSLWQALAWFVQVIPGTDERWREGMRSHGLRTLDAMVLGGLHDQVDGGFFRYSTDALWHIPHFEKMLTDNAQMISLLARFYAIQPSELWKQALENALSWCEGTMMAQRPGLWISALDADTAEGEGALYAWRQEEVADVLGSAGLLDRLGMEALEGLLDFWDITRQGNWENGRSLVHIPERIWKNLDREKIAQRLYSYAPMRAALSQARHQRPQPERDDKVVLEGNALLAHALLDAGQALDDWRKTSLGLHSLDTVWSHFRDEAGQWHHSLQFLEDGSASPGPHAFLEDLAQLASACFAAYASTLVPSWLNRTEELLEETLRLFGDDKKPLLRMTDASETLFAQPLPLQDYVQPSANSVLAGLLFQVGFLRDRDDWKLRSRSMVQTMREHALSEPLAHSGWLKAWAIQELPPIKVLMRGPEVQRWSRHLWRFFPQVLIGFAEGNPAEPWAQVCSENRCLSPVRDLKSLLEIVGKEIRLT
ncbi:MAG TPA: DUF255 domain-containing protein [Fibrobacteraceae bacterium]|nr:DUF255 domain-containing protein [Fibrobacteraceae bacterium]